MIEVTNAARDQIKNNLQEGKVVRMFLAAIDATGANYGMSLGELQKDDVVFESNGVKIYMSPMDAELLGETVIDYIDDDRGRGFLIRGPADEEIGGCGSCASGDSCDHYGSCDHESCDHDHDGCSGNHRGCGHEDYD